MVSDEADTAKVSAGRALDRLMTAGGAICASGGPLYSGAIFGRDSLEVAEDISKADPHRAVGIVLSVAMFQGVRQASPGPQSNEEEPGRIHHEARLETTALTPESAGSAEIRKRLSALWGGSSGGFVYYGSVDATPLFVRVVGALANSLGPDILATPLNRLDGTTTSLRECALEAALWVEQRIRATPMGLLTYRRDNPNGIQNQVWRDSWEAYLLPTGKTIPIGCPVATIEVQALAVDALRVAAEFLTDSGAQAEQFRTTANNIRMRTIRHFAMPDSQYLCAAVYLAPDGTYKQVKLMSSAPATLLDSTFFDGPNPDLFSKWRDAVARAILSTSFLCDAGVRTLSTAHLGMLPYTPYHGSGTSWPKETLDICRGLIRHGFTESATHLAALLQGSIQLSGGFPEFFYISQNGRVAHQLALTTSSDRKQAAILGTNIPEEPAAWTASAAVALASGILTPASGHRNSLDFKLAARLEQLTHISPAQDGPNVMTINTKRGQVLAHRALRTANTVLPIDYPQHPTNNRNDAPGIRPA